MIIRSEMVMGILFEVVTWFNVESDVRLVANHECGLYETIGIFNNVMDANKELNKMILDY
ncbi:MAG: hypothetical protein ACRCZ0_10935 [Cetobacterium sp.]